MLKIDSPWNKDQIESLNIFQVNGMFHPFTCGGNRGDEAHKQYARDHNQSDWGILVATEDGWICPVCGYKQNWAHDFMAQSTSQKD